MKTLDKVLYTARVHTTGGGRDGGVSKSDDGHLDITHTPPGKGGGSNPEQLFAAGYSACFIGAMKAVAAKQGITLPDDLSVDAEVDLGPVGQAYGVAVRMAIHLPGMDRDAAQKLIDTAHQVCPYSNATRDNIPVELTLA
ncbi:organic hydroperoxide resistance protein [Lysobacter oculi]|uniref:Organic hydroperoxide resistance protein n=1 Tax=Solilutibacter oculi TaxID=2698682 RepID=A0A344J807_9GAMM|nr:organic hydroperoxide resistance protein [Lysobacter oculi]AXA85167.1 organic hydroperoxide resistance protein [Lysobacter oculi]